MLIIDVGEVTQTKSTGTFFCPTCGSQQTCQLRTVRKFLRIYFIPLIPLEDVSQHLRCLKCRQQFDLNWLKQRAEGGGQLQPPQSGAVVLAAMRLVFALGRPTREQIVELQKLAQEWTGADATLEEMLEGRRWLERDGTVGDYLSDAALPPRDLDRAVQGLFRVAAAGGELSVLQQAELAGLTERLKMHPTRFRQLIIEEVRAAG